MKCTACNQDLFIQNNPKNMLLPLNQRNGYFFGCENDDCPVRHPGYSPYVFVDPVSQVVDSYALSFKHKDKWFIMEGKTIFFKLHNIRPPYKATAIYQHDEIGFGRRIVEMAYIPLPYDDSMQLVATKLFNRLMSLVVFS